MKPLCRFLASILGLLTAVSVVSAASPPATTSAGPALVTFQNGLVAAWAGAAGTSSHTVNYSTYQAAWSASQTIANALTDTAPALGEAGGLLYMATTPPNTNGQIYVYTATSGVFNPTPSPICQQSLCASTLATPALLGVGSTLYAFWTTPTGAIKYATLVGGEWNIAPVAVPNAQTSPTTGPTLAYYQNYLHLAWAAQSGTTATIVSTSFPLSPASWGTQHHVAVSTNVAPTLAVLNFSNPYTGSTSTLFLSYTTTTSGIDFAMQDDLSGSWVSSPPPFPLPPSPLTSFPVALAPLPNQIGNSDMMAYRTLVSVVDECIQQKPPGPPYMCASFPSGQ